MDIFQRKELIRDADEYSHVNAHTSHFYLLSCSEGRYNIEIYRMTLFNRLESLNALLAEKNRVVYFFPRLTFTSPPVHIITPTTNCSFTGTV